MALRIDGGCGGAGASGSRRGRCDGPRRRDAAAYGRFGEGQLSPYHEKYDAAQLVRQCAAQAGVQAFHARIVISLHAVGQFNDIRQERGKSCIVVLPGG
ncbi:hypothetical protein ID875_03080 [Streptomyces globisporus]|uniref:Uncharacterized protein n=1 Tax=Streptomyces globisporus TaxID=1908 RepID=A0A927BII7_STRGL|nr:hypothetical protein [Streptomyces globisporus]